VASICRARDQLFDVAGPGAVDGSVMISSPLGMDGVDIPCMGAGKAEAVKWAFCVGKFCVFGPISFC